MPRVNPLRATGNEENLARRIAVERESRGYSYEGLARRMTNAGYPIQPSAVFKIEKGKPPRRIAVDELVGFAEVFGLTPTDLLRPVDVVIDEALVTAFDAWTKASERLGAASAEHDVALEGLRTLIQAQGGKVRDALDKAMRSWIVRTYPASNVDEALEYFTLTLAGVPKSDRRWREHYKRWA